MNCTRVQQQLTNYLERNCDKADVAAIARHIEACGTCAQVMGQLQRTKMLIRGNGTFDCDPIAISEILTAVRERTTTPLPSTQMSQSKLRSFRHRRYLVATAAAVIAAAVTIGWGLVSKPQPMVIHRPAVNDDMTIYLQEHELHADKSVFTNRAFGSVSINRNGK